MKIEWKNYSIKDVILGLYDGPHATPKPSKSGPVFLGIKNLTDDGKIDLSEIKHIAEIDFFTWTKRVLPTENDIVFTYEATLNRYAIIPNNLRCCLGRRMALLRLDLNKVSPKFLFYYFFSFKWRQVIDQNTIVGATVNRIPINKFSSFPISLPKLIIQKLIAKVLSDLDSKIELNNKINTELEGMAKLIYEYWFVQFEFPFDFAQGKPTNETSNPQDIKPYKSSGGKMVWNAELKREIPEGWEVQELGNYATIKKGTLITEKTADTFGSVKVVSAGLGYSYYHSESNYNENTITISSSGASAGYINFWREPIFACDCTTVRGKTEAETMMILGLSKMRQNYLYSQARGSAQPHAYPKDIEGLQIAIPCEGIIEKYGQLVVSGNSTISINLKQNQQLSSLRDWLLPMLMNGQVRVMERELERGKVAERDR